MPDYTVVDLERWTGGRLRGLPDSACLHLSGFCPDSRKLQRGEAFVALRTASRDGHTFISFAQQQGANLALVQKPNEACDIPQLEVEDPLCALQSIAREQRRNFTGTVIGITGSCGKTSTKDLLAAMLGTSVLKTAGNLNNYLGVPMTLTQLDAEKHSFAVVEAGINQPAEMAVLADMIRPDITLITMVGPTHLEQLRSVEIVAEEKAKLATSENASGPVLFPANCLQYKAFAEVAERAWVVTDEEGLFASVETAQRIFYKSHYDAAVGCRLHLESAAFVSSRFQVPVLSPGMLSNVVLAIVAAKINDVSDEQIQTALNLWKPSALRGEIRRVGEDVFYIDCYNANPASMIDAWQIFGIQADASLPRLYVLGCMAELGERSDALHAETGQQLKLREQDRAIIIGEQASAFRGGLLAAGNAGSQLEIASSIESIQSQVTAHSGAVFLKGSRAYGLEKLIPPIEEK